MPLTLAAILACQTSGLKLTQTVKSLKKFKNVSRRLELIKVISDIKIYSDFAHHPTAIEKTIDALKESISEEGKLVVIIQPKSIQETVYIKNRLKMHSLEQINF